MGRLDNKVALVTGGAKGLGAAMCKVFAEEGATVAVTDIDEAGAQAVASDIEQAGGRAKAYRQDVTDEAGWETIAAALHSDLGGFDILVNNAGIAIMGTVEDATVEEWRKTMSVNLESVFLGTRQAIRSMKSQGSGSIINISSVEGIVGEPLVAAYNASKGGVRTFTKSAALHCAKSGYGIRVNSIHPGFVDTELVSGAVATLDDPEGFVADVVARCPTGAFGEPKDVAYAALYLASDESKHVIGAEMVVDGGYIAQ